MAARARLPNMVACRLPNVAARARLSNWLRDVSLIWLRDASLIWQLEHVSHVVVDEVHERDTQTDLLILLIRELLPSRPQ
eukprot:242478-Prymnesium_polylepis.1